MLAPYQRERHKNKLINGTGGVNAKPDRVSAANPEIRIFPNSPECPLRFPWFRNREHWNPETIRESLKHFQFNLKPIRSQTEGFQSLYYK